MWLNKTTSRQGQAKYFDKNINFDKHKVIKVYQRVRDIA